MKRFTKKEKTEIDFLGNMVRISGQINGLKLFLEDVNKFIQLTEQGLKTEKSKDFDSEKLHNLKYHYKYTQGDLLRKSIIISTVILLESEIDNYCRDFKSLKKLKVSYKDFNGSLLDRFKSFTTKILDLSFDFNSSQWLSIKELYEISNCLVHNYASLENFGKSEVIKTFIKKHKNFEISDNEFIEISNEGCLECIEIVNIFFKNITRIAMDCFPEKYHTTEFEWMESL